MEEKDYHQISPQAALKMLKVTIEEGLDAIQVEEQRRKYGYNELETLQSESLLKAIFNAIKEPLMLILLAAALISLVIGQIGDAIGIILAITIGISIGIIVEGESQRAADQLKKVCENISVKVIRNGKVTVTTSKELVPKDIVLIQSGDKVPADGRLIKSDGLTLDESMLTGESEPTKKDADLILDSFKAIPADKKNMLFSGSLVTEGSGIMVVVHTGNNTEVGKINKNLDVDNTITPLQHKLGVLGGRISKISTIIALMLFVFEVMQIWPSIHPVTTSFKAFLESVDPIRDAFVVSVALIVAAVPEGLPTMVNITLALTMGKMAQINALVRKKEACETIGSVSVICSDKTGTLTQNKMAVVDLFMNNKFMKNQFPSNHFINNCCLNSTANIELINGQTNFIGNTTECALLQFLSHDNVDYSFIRKTKKIIRQFEFNSSKKLMGTIASLEDSRIDNYIFYIKGAPEKIIQKCSLIDINGNIVKLTGITKAMLEENIIKLQSEAKRVIAFAYKPIPKKTRLYERMDETEDSFIFTGFTGIMDPLRPDVKKAILTAKRAGVETKILTGDNINTAVAIANQLRILENGKRAVTSFEIDGMDDDTLRREINSIGVVARSTPETKMRVVQALKSRNHVVAVTGDGINDAPALVKSDVGISMGITGTEVSQEASDIILKDDSFATIIKGIKWGRGIYENFQRFIQFQLTVNIVAFVTATLSIVFGFKLPFTTIQLLWVNIIMDGPPALSLGLEPVRDNVLNKKPINRRASILSRGMFKSMIINALIMVSGILIISRHPEIIASRPLNVTELGSSYDDKLCGTILFNVFAFFALWNALNCREFGRSSIIPNFTKNSFALKIILMTAIIQIGIVQFGSNFFNAVPLELTMWIKIIVYTFSIVLINEIAKFVLRLLTGSKEQKNSYVVVKF